MFRRKYCEFMISVRLNNSSRRKIFVAQVKILRLQLYSILLVIISFSQFSCQTNHRSIEKGELSLRLGDYLMAIRFFDEVLSRNPENFDARLGMGKALIQQASAKHHDSLTWSKALTNLEAARSIRPESNIEPLLCEAWTIHSQMLLRTSDTNASLNALSRAIEYNPRAVEALNSAGIIYFRLGELEKASILFNRALMADTSRPFTYFNIGMIRWSIQDVKGANEAWFKAVQLAPGDKDIVYWYAASEKKLRGVTQ
jgi:tetratricopeptide (TPR) repeat protein